jgi:hypothetical protein
MNGLSQALGQLSQLLEQMGLPYAVMGGLAVRLYGIPRATYDIDLTVAIERARLPDLFQAAEGLGYSVPEAYSSGWTDQVAGMPLIKLRLYLEGHGIDIDIFLAETTFQRVLLQRRRREETDIGPSGLSAPKI